MNQSHTPGIAFGLIIITAIASCAKHSPGISTDTAAVSHSQETPVCQASQSDLLSSELSAEHHSGVEATVSSDSIDVDRELCVVKMITQPAQMPPEWLEPRYAPFETLFLPASEYPKWESTLCYTLDKYPAGVIARNVSAVSPLAKLVIGGARLGGASVGTRIFVVVSKKDMTPQTPEMVESTLHQKIASVLAFNYPNCISWNEWDKELPDKFVRTGWGGATSATKLETTVALKEAGFLVGYATGSAELDFGVYVSKLMCGDSEIWQDYTNYSRIQSKIELTIKMLSCIDARFSKEYFRGMIVVKGNK